MFTGRIERADSIFKYTEDTTFEMFDRKNFEPVFLQEVLDKMTAEQRKLVKDKCNGNNECIFDYAITGMYAVVRIANNRNVQCDSVRACVYVCACVYDWCMAVEH